MTVHVPEPEDDRFGRARANIHRSAHAQRFPRRARSGRTAAQGGGSGQDGPDQRQPVAAAHPVPALQGGEGRLRPRFRPAISRRHEAPVVAISATTRSSTSTCRSCSRTPTPRPGSPATRTSPRAARSRTDVAGRLSDPRAARRRARHRPDDRLRQRQGRCGILPGGNVKSNVLINIGYGENASKLFPRSPRFDFDQIAKII